MNPKVSHPGWILAAVVAVLASFGVGRALFVEGCLPFAGPRISVADVDPHGEVLVSAAVCTSR